MSALVTGMLLAPAPAQAAVGAARLVLVAPLEGFIAVEGLDNDELTTIEVRRNGVLVSSVTARPADWGVPGALEVNHLADPTLCWEGSTPEILPGDVVHIIGSGSTPATTFEDTVDIIDLKITQEVTQTGPGQATVKGFVGTPRPDIALLDVFLRADDGVDFRRNASEAPNTMEYDTADPNNGAWTATFNDLTQSQIDAAMTPKVLEAEFARAANEIIAAPPGDVQGDPEDPACPPLARHAVTDISPAVVNIANDGVDVTISGVTANATAVEVSLNGGLTENADVTGAPGSPQSWSVVYPGADLSGLTGTIEVTADHTTSGGVLAGRSMSFVRDVTAPGLPSITPDGGTHDNSVEVSMTPPEPGADIFYTLDGSAPTTASTKYTGPFTRTSTTTVRAIAVDTAGNPGGIAQSVLTVAHPPGAPINLDPSAGNTTATLSWAAGPANNRAIDSYTVRAQANGEPTLTQTVDDTQLSHTFTGLTNGKAYTLSVRAHNTAGDGPFATASPVTPVGPPSAPTNVTGEPMNGAAKVSWQAPADNGGTPITGYKVFTYEAALQVGLPTEFGPEATSGIIPGLTNGTSYTFRVVAMNSEGDSAESAPTGTVRPEEAPLRPRILKGKDGRPGGAITAVARWLAPTANTATIENYVVQAWKIRKGKRNVLKGEAVVGPNKRMKKMHLPKGVYKFRVRAIGLADDSRWSKRSPKVRAQ